LQHTPLHERTTNKFHGFSTDIGRQFRDDVLMPRMQAGIEGGFPTPPEEKAAFEVSNLQP